MIDPKHVSLLMWQCGIEKELSWIALDVGKFVILFSVQTHHLPFPDVGTISSVKVALEAEGDIKTRKRRSLETKTKRLLDGWTLKNVSANVEYINNNNHLARKNALILICGHYLFREADRGKLWALGNRWCPRTNIRAYFCAKMEAIVFIILGIFFETRAVFKTRK